MWEEGVAMGWKYIMLESGMFRYPIIFPDKLVHDEVVKQIIPLIPGKEVKIISAGSIEGVEVDGVGGRSTTLNIDSLGEEDERLINVYNYGHGIV